MKLGDVELHVEVRSAAHRERRRRSCSAPIPGPDEDGPARFPRLRPGSRLKRLEADEGDLRFVLSGPDGRFVRMSADDADLLELLNGERRSRACIAAASGRFGPDGPSRLASLLADLGERGLLVGVEEARAGAAEEARWMRLFRTRQWDFTWLGPVFERVYRAGGCVLFTLPVLLVIAAVCAAGLVASSYLIGGRDVAPFVVASKVGLGGLDLPARAVPGRGRARVRPRADRRVVRAEGAEGRAQAGARLSRTRTWTPRRRGSSRRGGGSRSRAPGPSATSRSAARRRSLTVFWPAGTMQDVWFQLALAAYTGAIFNLNPLLDRDGYHILVDLMREPGLRRRSREWLAAQALRARPAEPDDAGVLATYARDRARLVARDASPSPWSMSQRYYGYLTALAPASVVWTVLIAFYVLMLLPILGVFWKAFRRGGATGGRRSKVQSSDEEARAAELLERLLTDERVPRELPPRPGGGVRGLRPARARRGVRRRRREQVLHTLEIRESRSCLAGRVHGGGLGGHGRGRPPAGLHESSTSTGDAHRVVHKALTSPPPARGRPDRDPAARASSTSCRT